MVYTNGFITQNVGILQMYVYGLVVITVCTVFFCIDTALYPESPVV
jgi:hypothetical protein